MDHGGEEDALELGIEALLRRDGEHIGAGAGRCEGVGDIGDELAGGAVVRVGARPEVVVVVAVGGVSHSTVLQKVAKKGFAVP